MKCRISSVYVPFVQQRYVICILALLGTMVASMVYLSGYKTKREMVYKPVIWCTAMSYSQDRCYQSRLAIDIRAKEHAKVYWSSALSRSVMDVYWVSYVVSTVATGLLVDMVGPRHIWGVGGLLAAFASVLTIVTATVNPYISLVCISFTGFGLGVVNPCFTTMVAHWAPQNTRTLTMALMESGTMIGMIIVFVFHDNLTADNGGWEIWVYISCVTSIVWGIVWYLLFYNKPAQHPHISHKELHYLRATTVGVRRLTQPTDRKIPLVPWKQILLSTPVWSLQLINLGSTWVHSLVFYHMNKYLLYVFNVSSSIVQGEYTNVLAQGTCMISLIVHGYISDKLMSTGLTSRTANRRFFLLFSNYLSACLLLAIPLLGCWMYAVLLAFFAMIHLQAMALGPLLSNAVDLSPRYAGLIQGFMTAGKGFAILCCRRLVKSKVTDMTVHEDWAEVFNISAVLLIVFSMPYMCFGSGEIQEWNFFFKRKSAETEVNQRSDVQLTEGLSDVQPDIGTENKKKLVNE